MTKTKFKGTLGEVIQELTEEECRAITRILPLSDDEFIFEYEVENGTI